MTEMKYVKCQNCGKRDATVQWVGEGGFLAFTHGLYEWWCNVCALEAQIEYAKEQASKLPMLENQLAELLDSEMIDQHGGYLPQ